MGREKEKAVVPTLVLKDQVGVMMYRGTSGFFLRPLNVLLFAKPMFGYGMTFLIHIQFVNELFAHAPRCRLMF